MRKRRATIVEKILDRYFPDPPIPLYHKNSFTLLVAVMLSARATDASVNKVTPLLFELADTPEKMRYLSYEELLKIIRPIGLSPTKAKNILAMSEILVRRFKGQIPKTMAALEKLPGVGHKTASVIMVQCYKKPAFPVDTHIFRCARRWGLSQGKNVTQVERDLKRLFSKKKWIKLHLQIIYFARKYCPAKGHDPSKCPICIELN